MFPSEFIASFEKQYPKPALEYTLPKSLDKCPEMKNIVEHRIKVTNQYELSYMDDNGVTYDILSRRYRTYDNPTQWHKMSPQGYDSIFNILYKKYGGNISPKSFAFVLDDLAEINPAKFEAELAMQCSTFNLAKAIALNQSWFKYCLEFPSNFKMDYDEYNEIVKDCSSGERWEDNSGNNASDDSDSATFTEGV